LENSDQMPQEPLPSDMEFQDRPGVLCMPDTLDYYTEVHKRFEATPSARKLNLTECQRCGLCCYGVTCTPRPDEIETAASHLGLTVAELIRKYMVVDKFGGSNYLLRWAKKGQEDLCGTLIPEERRLDSTYCIFFDEESKLCRIYPARPHEAAVWQCWDVNLDYLYENGAASVCAWGESDIFKFLPSFKPEGESEYHTTITNESAEKEVQDTSCRGSGGVPPD
jgi:Fe-S-cluster containining protein